MSNLIEIARRGQVTIPKALRDDFGIKEGHKYSVRALDGGVLIFTPQADADFDALRTLRAHLIEQGVTLEDMLAELRRMRETNDE